jgi:hypothetical protein
VVAGGSRSSVFVRVNVEMVTVAINSNRSFLIMWSRLAEIH